MAFLTTQNNIFSSILFAMIFTLLLSNTQCFNPKLLNVSNYYQSSGDGWSVASATWYGSPVGGGSNGGACGYTDAVEKPPFSSMVTAVDSSLYQSGAECGVCYQVKCTENKACSGNPVTVTITDQCPGCPSTHFDLSGAAFGAMAKAGLDGQLRDAGKFNIQYKRVKCTYPGMTIQVRVDPGSNPSYFASAIEYVDGEGIQNVKLKQESGEWIKMEQSWGAVWKADPGHVLQPPLSLQLCEAQTGNTLTLDNVIPKNWTPGQTYRSHVNFNN